MQPKDYDKVLTYVRLKPISKISVFKKNKNEIIYDKTNEKYAYYDVFNEEINNKEIFDIAIKPNLSNILDGINLTIFTYGQTSSGKTHTMKGNKSDKGILLQTLKYLFDNYKNNQQFQIQFKISYFELYKEKFRDLLVKDGSKLLLREIKKIFILEGLKEKTIDSYEDSVNKYFKGEEHRSYGITNLNEQSSRSHVIFKIKIFSNNSGNKKESEILLIDLAGSESLDDNANSILKNESKEINRSLTSLNKLITEMSKNKNNFYNYRDSNLTKILKNSLSGNSKTILLCTINPSTEYIKYTLNTLRFGNNISEIIIPYKNEIKKIEKITEKKNQQNDDLQEENDILRKQNSKLLKQNKEIMEENEIYYDINKKIEYNLINEKNINIKNENEIKSILFENEKYNKIFKNFICNTEFNSFEEFKNDFINKNYIEIKNLKESIEILKYKLSENNEESDIQYSNNINPILIYNKRIIDKESCRECQKLNKNYELALNKIKQDNNNNINLLKTKLNLFNKEQIKINLFEKKEIENEKNIRKNLIDFSKDELTIKIEYLNKDIKRLEKQFKLEKKETQFLKNKQEKYIIEIELLKNRKNNYLNN